MIIITVSCLACQTMNRETRWTLISWLTFKLVSAFLKFQNKMTTCKSLMDAVVSSLK